MRTNTSHDEDDEDNIDNRLGRKSDSKVGKMYQYLMFHYFTQFRKYNSHKKKLLKKGFILNEWILYQKEGLLFCMQSFQTPSVSP